MSKAEASSAPEYTIDELAAATKVPSRTIRFYQSKGALPRPEIKGRVAFYGEAHVERLKLIGSLQDRGLRIDAIRDLVSRIDKGEVDVAEWLGLEAQLQAPWAHEKPRVLSEAELLDLAGTRRPGLLADLLRGKLVKRHADAYFVRSPALLQIAMKLEAAGFELAFSAQCAEVLRKYMAKAAQDLVELFMKNADDVFTGRADGEGASAAFQELRPVALDAVRLVFGQEMERALRKLLESGKATKLRTKPKKRG